MSTPTHTIAPMSHAEAPAASAPHWPYSALHGHPGFHTAWGAHFGQGACRHVSLDLPDQSLPCLITRNHRVRELGERFVIAPEDAEFVQEARKRLFPLRQLSPAMSLEAGNLRGNGVMSATLGDDLAQALGQIRGWDYAQLPIAQSDRLPLMRALADHGFQTVARPTGRVFKAHLDFAGWDAFLSTRSRNFRKNIKRMDQTLTRSDARIEIWQGPNLAQGLSLLEDCAKQSWKARAEPPQDNVQLPLTKRQIAFHQALDQQPGINLMIATLSDQARCVGAMMWGICDGWMTGLLTYFDPAAARLSPGHALMRHSMQWAQTQGLKQFDFNATGTWLEAYANAQSPFDTLIITPPGLWGTLLHRLAKRSGQTLAQFDVQQTAGGVNANQA